MKEGAREELRKWQEARNRRDLPLELERLVRHLREGRKLELALLKPFTARLHCTSIMSSARSGAPEGAHRDLEAACEEE